jgi:hypothetical protein
MSLRDRCKKVLDKMAMDGMLRQNSPVDTLLEFVISEQGRAADSRLEETLPLCLYFTSDEERDEFITLVRDAKPGMSMRKV